MGTPFLGQWAEIGGLNLLGLDEFGVSWYMGTLDGWDDSTGPTISLVPKPRAAGAWAGDSFNKERHIAASGSAIAPTAALLLDARDRLMSAIAKYDTMLTVVEGGASRWAMVRRSDIVIWKPLGTTATWSIQVVATDPRKFGDQLSASTLLPASSGGLTVPFTVPFTVPAVSVSGQVSLNNSGNETGPVWLRIDGPCTGPVVTHVGSGLSLTFSSSLVLQAGEWLDVDMERHTVLANGQASRSGYVTSRGWSGLEPGNNVWQFTSASFNSASRLTVTATPSWE